MFKNDRMMMILTGLVLAIFAGSMAKYGDKIMALMSGESAVVSQNDSYSVRAGSQQILDVLSNDALKGPIVVLSRPACGLVELTGNDKLSYSSLEDCSGEVEFAYCVVNDGACEPNAVKINVISVAYSGGNTAVATSNSNTTTTPAANNAASTPEADIVAQAPAAPAADESAPAIASFSVEMTPPTLAAPSVSEFVSPSVAVASIRKPVAELDSTANTDQNITTQNSASVSQSASVAPSTFAAPGMGESNNISLGGSGNTVVATAPTPTGLQASGAVDSTLAKLERGPEALASVQNGPAAPAPQESSPLAASAERSEFAPVEVAAVQAAAPAPAPDFHAAPTNDGPIALIALQSANSGGNAGESLNVILSEPGLQSFAAPLSTPDTLAPTSDSPTAVSVLERAPAVLDQSAPLGAAPTGNNASVAIANAADAAITGPALSPLSASGADSSAFSADKTVVASLPAQIAVPGGFALPLPISRVTAVSAFTPQPHNADTPVMTAPNRTQFSVPAIDLTPAAAPEILQASLPVTAAAPVVETAPAQSSACDIVLLAQPSSGANIQLEIFAGCKPEQMATVTHAGLSFSVMTDTKGAASVNFPAMQADAEVAVTFSDQSSSTAELSVPGMDAVTRAGVSWQGGVDLDLNALEFGAALGSEGNVTPESPRSYRTARIKGGGYLVQLGDPNLPDGSFAEVYSLPTNRNQERGTIALSILIGDAAPVCGQTIEAKTSRTRDGRSAGVRNVRFAVPACGSIDGPIQLTGAINDIRVAGR